MNFSEAKNYINSFPKLGEPVTSLNRFRELCGKFSNPQNSLSFVHVAGTNGKGSTVRMITEVLTTAGYKTGEFTSPYIRQWSERIRINGVNIPQNELCAIVEYIKPVFDREIRRYSQFELATIIAFIYFAYQKCDIVVLETGIGGLLDCTNIVTTTILSVITSISLDHTMILGDTIAAIAEQKAGIIKPLSATVIYPDNPPEAELVVLKTAASQKSDFIKPDLSKLKIIESNLSGSRFRYKHKSFDIRMVGKHQIYNAVTALEATRALHRAGFLSLKYSCEYEGLSSAYLHSRCQIIHDKPLIILDGAHNPDGMKKLCDFIRSYASNPRTNRTVMVVGMREDKDWEGALSEISRYIDRAVCIDGFMPGTVPSSKLAGVFKDAITAPVSEAVSKAVRIAGENGIVIIGGSLYLAEALNKYMINTI